MIWWLIGGQYMVMYGCAYYQKLYFIGLKVQHGDGPISCPSYGEAISDSFLLIITTNLLHLNLCRVCYAWNDNSIAHGMARILFWLKSDRAYLVHTQTTFWGKINFSIAFSRTGEVTFWKIEQNSLYSYRQHRHIQGKHIYNRRSR